MRANQAPEIGNDTLQMFKKMLWVFSTVYVFVAFTFALTLTQEESWFESLVTAPGAALFGFFGSLVITGFGLTLLSINEKLEKISVLLEKNDN